MSRTNRLGLPAILLTSALVVTACSGETVTAAGGGGEGDKTIDIGYIAWDENIANTYLWKELLERQGYTVNLFQLEVAALYSGVAQNDLDVFMSSTPLVHADYYDEFGDQIHQVGQWYDTLVQGVAVPEYVDMTTMEDLAANPEAVGGRIIGIEPGSGLMRMLKDNAVDDYGLDALEVVDGSTPAMLASLDSAIAKEEPVAVTLWNPHWALNKYPVRLLEDPEQAFGEPDIYTSIVSQEFLDSKDPFLEQLERFHMTPEELLGLEQMISEMGDEEKAVEEWISQNEDVVAEWTGDQA